MQLWCGKGSVPDCRFKLLQSFHLTTFKFKSSICYIFCVPKTLSAQRRFSSHAKKGIWTLTEQCQKQSHNWLFHVVSKNEDVNCGPLFIPYWFETTTITLVKQTKRGTTPWEKSDVHLTNWDLDGVLFEIWVLNYVTKTYNMKTKGTLSVQVSEVRNIELCQKFTETVCGLSLENVFTRL